MEGIGVDLGGTKIEFARVSRAGEMIVKDRVPTDVAGGPEAIQAQICEGVRRLSEGQALPVGVGVAGQIADTSIVRFAPNLKWRGVDLGRHLRSSLGVPVAVTNDVRAATWAEWLYGSGRGCHDLLCMFIGTGIGGGIVAGGRMVEGVADTAGEIGHLIVSLDGPDCPCGSRGCAEAIGGGASIARHAQHRVRPGDLLLEIAGSTEAITTKTVVDAYRAGDSLATELLMEARRAITALSASLINVLGPEKLILGGGIVNGLPEMVDWVGEGVKHLALGAPQEKLQVVSAHFHNDAPVLGAAAFGMTRAEQAQAD